MEKLSELVLELMDKGVISPRQASVFMRYVGEKDFSEEKLSIVERLRARTISFDQAIELLAGLVGDDDVAEKALARQTFWKRRRQLVVVFRTLMIVTLVAIVCTLHITIPRVSEALAQKRTGPHLTLKAMTFVQILPTIILLPELILLWLEAGFTLLAAPTTMLPNTFTASGTHDKLFWLLGLVAGAALGLMAVVKMFASEAIFLQNVWLVLWIVCLAVPPIGFFWVGFPKKRELT